MGLDYTDGCVNLRDVGEYINLIVDKPILPEKVLYRGGSIDYINSDADIYRVKSIVNLRNRVDFDGRDAAYNYFPMANKVEKYDTTQKGVRRWLNQIVRAFENPGLAYPVLIHCLSGKDRTGIVVASLLLILQIDVEAIVEEYLMSEGEVSRDLILQAIDGIGDVNTYFAGVDLDLVRRHILSDQT